MIWNQIVWWGVPALALWLAGALAARRWTKLALALSLAGWLCLGAFTALLWRDLGRPPVRTLGETRLLYAFFLSGLGIWTAWRGGHSWLLALSNILASVFLALLMARPGMQAGPLMPALQSGWFVPHVAAYIFAYALLGVGTLMALRQLAASRGAPGADSGLLPAIDGTVRLGFAFLVLGMLTGAVWAKEAWGHYWSWDPKETWAFVTACAYLVYFHARARHAGSRAILWLLPAAFVLLLVAWLGVSFIPAAQQSVHVYS